MYKVSFEKRAYKEFMKLDGEAQQVVAEKIKSLQRGDFHGDKALKGKHNGKFRKHAGNYRIVYYKENRLLVITIIRIAHRKEVY